MLILLLLLALLTGGVAGVAAALAVVRAAAHTGGHSPALRHLTGLREQLQTEHAVALAVAACRGDERFSPR